MTDAAERYDRLAHDLDDARASGDDEGEDAILEEMGDLWWEMDKDERAERNFR